MKKRGLNTSLRLSRKRIIFQRPSQTHIKAPQKRIEDFEIVSLRSLANTSMNWRRAVSLAKFLTKLTALRQISSGFWLATDTRLRTSTNIAALAALVPGGTVPIVGCTTVLSVEMKTHIGDGIVSQNNLFPPAKLGIARTGSPVKNSYMSP